jgi:hypothetical protein
MEPEEQLLSLLDNSGEVSADAPPELPGLNTTRNSSQDQSEHEVLIGQILEKIQCLREARLACAPEEEQPLREVLEDTEKTQEDVVSFCSSIKSLQAYIAKIYRASQLAQQREAAARGRPRLTVLTPAQYPGPRRSPLGPGSTTSSGTCEYVLHMLHTR